MFDHRYNPKKPPLPLLPLRFKVYGFAFVLVAATSHRGSVVQRFFLWLPRCAHEFTKHARLSFSHVNGAPSPMMVIEFLCALSTAALTWSVTVKKTLSEDSSESNRLSPAPRK